MWVGLAMFALAAMVLAYDRARLLSLIVRLKSIGISRGSLAHTQPTRPPPVAVAGGIGAIPVVGSIYMLLSIIFDPTRLVQRLRLTYGPVFTLRIPFHFDIAYFLGEEGYRTVMSMRPGEEGKGAAAAFGSVMARVPSIGFWYPRGPPRDGETEDERLQSLLLASRGFMRDRMKPRAVDAMEPTMRATAARHVASWTSSNKAELDLSSALVNVAHDAAGRCAVGDILWDHIGARAAPLLNKIVRGVDIPRTTACTLPWYRTTPEYRATMLLRQLLDETVAMHRRREATFPIIDELAAVGGVSDADVSWMLMNLLWHSLNYTGSYFFWSFVEALHHEPTHRALTDKTISGERRRATCWNAIRETLRMHPVSSLVRATSEQVIVRHGGKAYTVPAGCYIGTTPHHLTHDEKRYRGAERYDPSRYERGEGTPSAFGRGAFSCIAQTFVRTLFVTLMDEIFSRCDVELVSDRLPRRLCRVHLIYPERPVIARVRTNRSRLRERSDAGAPATTSIAPRSLCLMERTRNAAAVCPVTGLS